MDLVQNKDLLESLSYLVAILGGLFGAIYFFNKYYKEFNKRVDIAFTGMWVNEGCINCTEKLTHSIDLSLESINRELNGVISVRNFINDSEWNELSVIGKRIFRFSRIDVLHVRQGEVMTVAKVKLRLKKKSMYWKLVTGTSDFFPDNTVLWSNK